jgi:hypothetical protein
VLQFPLQIDLRFLRDVIVVGTGCACIGSQIMAQKAGVPISGELIVSGVTLLTATPFIWKGDTRTDDKNRGKHEAR